jgi:hypothetical protein
MSKKSRGAIHSIDWYQELLKAIFNTTIGLVLREVIRRLSRKLSGNLRPVLTLAGVAYAGWLVFGFLMWLAGTYQTVRGPYTIVSVASYLITTFGLLFVASISGIGLNRLAYRIDPSHWTARMTNGLETRKRNLKDPGRVPPYIQQLPLIQPADQP